MEKHNYEEELKKERRLVGSLICEIDYKSHQLSEMEHKYNETTKTLVGLIDGLTAKINSKNSSLQDWELRYNKTVRQLRDEKTELHDEFVEEIRKVNSENIKLKCELSQQTKELEECRSQNDVERRSLLNEMTSGLKDILNSRTTLGVKRMGEIDQKAFEYACSLKFPKEDLQEICAKLCSSWEQNVQDPKWHPFKKILLKGKLQEIVDEDDEKLQELRNEYGEVAFEAVSTALMEMNEYNASGRYAVPEVWNIKEGRRASMKEIIQYIIKQLKSHKRKRKRI
ncbi:hypothetical protein DITRI_Ditri14bG0114600 [Diplodiscus trichospermus]